MRYAIRVAGRPGRDVGYLPGTVVALLYKQEGVSQDLGDPNAVYARITMVPDVSQRPVLWMAIEDQFLHDIRMKQVLMAMVATFGRNSAFWQVARRGAPPRLGHGLWLPNDRYHGPNFFGGWFGPQGL